MAEPLRMPRLSDEMKEATLSRWLKSVGDSVDKGEAVAEVETEKVIVEVEAPTAGILLELLVAEQEVVQVDQPICVIGAPGERVAASPKGRASPRQDAAAVEPAPSPPPATLSPAPGGAAGSNVVQLKHRGPSLEVDPARGRTGPRPAASASPLARRVADELGIDLTLVRGTGLGGKIVIADLQPFMDQPAGTSVGMPGAPLRPPPPLSTLPAEPTPAGGYPPLPQAPPAQGAGGAAAYQALPHSTLRRTIARRMSEAKGGIPHFYMTSEIDLTECLALRERLNQRLGEDKLSLNDVMIKAAALALEQVPALNATYADEAVHRYEGVHIGFAVAIDDGLVTPVVRDCHLKSLGRIARETRALIELARRRELTAEHLQGGTFTLSNLGMYEVVEFSAIINPPQVGILAIARPVERPVADRGRVVIRSLLHATLSADHRAVDGVIGATFLRAFKAVLEQPERLML